MQQHCNIRGYIPHGHNPNISLNHKWKYYRGKSHYVLDPQKTETGGETVSKLTGSSFKIDLHKSSLILYSAFIGDRSSVMKFRNKNWGVAIRSLPSQPWEGHTGISTCLKVRHYLCI